MPQDELWAASARLTGYQLSYYFDGPSNEADMFAVRTLWSKEPREVVKGTTVVDVPTYLRNHFPAVMCAVHFELTGGIARNVPGVVQAKLRMLRMGFEQGALH